MAGMADRLPQGLHVVVADAEEHRSGRAGFAQAPQARRDGRDPPTAEMRPENSENPWCPSRQQAADSPPADAEASSTARGAELVSTLTQWRHAPSDTAIAAVRVTPAALEEDPHGSGSLRS
jgi:hypothetical protein